MPPCTGPRPAGEAAVPSDTDPSYPEHDHIEHDDRSTTNRKLDAVKPSSETVAIDPVSSRTWTVGKVMATAARRSERPDGQLVEIFAVLDSLANRPDREARAFVQELASHAAEFEERVRELATATEMGEAFVGPWMLLLRGAASGLLLGDLSAAVHARDFTQLLIAATAISVGAVVPLDGTDEEAARAEVAEWLETLD